MQQISRKGEPQEAEAHQHKEGGPELAPDSLLPTQPGLDRVKEHHQRSNGPENANYLNEVKPQIPAITEDL
jgi:hypothetical protein